jgi:hypothetical protein
MTPQLLASVGWVTYLLYAVCCAVSFIWVSLSVPETRGVAVGPAMNEIFGDKEIIVDEEAMCEDNEVTPLLV